MTTTDAAKLREAAERVQNVVASWKQEDIDKLNHEPCRVMLEMWKSDISSLARHVLATVPEDGEEKCCGRTGCQNPAKPLHTCPYKEEINDDTTTQCTCCDDCRYECAMDI